MAETGKLMKGVVRVATGKDFSAGGALAAFGAEGGRGLRVAAEAAVRHDFHLGQQRGQGAGGSRFGRAAFAADQHAANTRVNSV